MVEMLEGRKEDVIEWLRGRLEKARKVGQVRIMRGISFTWYVRENNPR